MKIAIGCDETAFELKEIIKAYLEQQSEVSVEIKDFGVNSTIPVDYPDIAVLVAEAVACNQCERGVLLCGTGIGMAITSQQGRRNSRCFVS